MITILDIAIAHGAKEIDGGINMAEFDRLGLPFMGGCQHCGASIAAYNACPGRNGWLIGTCCVLCEETYATVAEYDLEQECQVLHYWGRRRSLSRCVSEILQANRTFEELYEDVDRFHGPSECYPDGEKLEQEIDGIAFRYGYEDLGDVKDAVTERCHIGVTYRLGL